MTANLSRLFITQSLTGGYGDYLWGHLFLANVTLKPSLATFRAFCQTQQNRCSWCSCSSKTFDTEAAVTEGHTLKGERPDVHLEGLEGGPLAGVALPALAHDGGEALGTGGRNHRAQALLDDADSRLQGGHLLVGDPPGQQLPHQDAEGEHVRLLAVGIVLNHLRRHPPATAQRE